MATLLAPPAVPAAITRREPALVKVDLVVVDLVVEERVEMTGDIEEGA